MIKNKATLFVTLALFGFASHGVAGELDDASQEALQKTTQVLTNKSERESLKKDNAALQKVDRDVESLTGDGKNKEAMYEAAAKILGDMARESGGDADKMKAIIDEAQANPAAFYQKLSGDQKSMIRGIAEDIEKIDSKQP